MQKSDRHIKTSTRNQLQIYKQLFKAIDIDNSGTIEVRELCMALQKLNIHMDEKMAQDLVFLVDQNNDGNMDEDEFCQFLYICSKTQSNDPKAILFYAADTDYSGNLDRNELVMILKKLGIQYSSDQFENWYSTIVDDNDDTISYEMFLNFIDALNEQ